MFGLTEASIVKKAQKGDSSAVGWLFDNHHEAIFRFIWLRVRDHALAEDLTGEVFMRMVAELPRYQNRDLPFRAWLYRIAHNLVANWFGICCIFRGIETQNNVFTLARTIGWEVENAVAIGIDQANFCQQCLCLLCVIVHGAKGSIGFVSVDMNLGPVERTRGTGSPIVHL